MEYLQVDTVILGSSSFIPKTIQRQGEHKSQLFPQGRGDYSSSTAVESAFGAG